MGRSAFLAGLAFAVALGQGSVLVPRAATAAEEKAPETIAGVVTKIDRERSRVTVRSSDQEIHEFEASAETLAALKVGDRIEMKRRPEPGGLGPSEP